ncbi:hypothetical protein FHP25_33695 [Vineibacter terrae]|uniref:Uncharacterized protein n=1 Tax=Vineibacter terrae TaxID=2586908 RepID=A0A5C8PAN2_9HYPH|nr:hypothetical protein [Vineibacter terrae]TXL70608.1 hypothetical protein FHP25_33695 [Vineibacter terrae]
MSGHRIDVKREGHGFAVTVDGDSPRACADIADVVAVVDSVMPGSARTANAAPPGKTPANANGSAAGTDPHDETAAGSGPDAVVS